MDLTGLRDAQTAGKALFLGVSAWVSWAEISMCITRLSKDVLHNKGGIIGAIQSRIEQRSRGRRDSLSAELTSMPTGYAATSV